VHWRFGWAVTAQTKPPKYIIADSGDFSRIRLIFSLRIPDLINKTSEKLFRIQDPWLLYVEYFQNFRFPDLLHLKWLLAGGHQQPGSATMPQISLLGLQLPQAALQSATATSAKAEDKATTPPTVMPSISGTVPASVAEPEPHHFVGAATQF
jgi:hypothetical protein